MQHSTKQDLISLRPNFKFFVGVDSDGCVFDTMAVKQCQHFHPLIIKHWGLEKIAKQVREVSEFINLNSRFRGTNRFPSLLKTFEMLPSRPGVAESGVRMPPLEDLGAYCTSGLPLGNASLKAEVERTGSKQLADVLAWSLAVNEDIEHNMKAVPPFEYAAESLEAISRLADIVVVSQTPSEALVREWHQHGINNLTRAIAGQELGTKAEHIRLAADGKYEPGRMLLIGDALGDLAAARATGILFYPVMPGNEVESWRLFKDEVMEKFFAGEYAGELENQLVDKFEKSLPSSM